MEWNEPERRRRPRGRLRILNDVLYRTLRFISRHVQGFFGALTSFLVIGFLASLGAAAVFLVFGGIVREGLTQSFDVLVLRRIAAYRTPFLNEAMVEITTLGNTFVLLVLVAVASVFLWLTRHHYSALLLIIAVLGGDVLNTLLKFTYARPRPTVVPWITETTSPSFPSGHAMAAMIVYGSVAFLVGRLEPTASLRRATWSFAALFILAIGASRVYLGVHYPSDVLAGYVAGAAWLLFVIAGISAVRFFAAERRPQIEREEKGIYSSDERSAGEER